MRIEKLYVQNFRNYEEAEISFSDGVNLIYGNNGQGKTNLAEAVYLFSAARSHRTAREKDMIQIGKEAARTKIYFSAAGREMNADFRIFQNKPHEITVNDVKKIKNSELMGVFQAVMFSPEDFSFIKDGPSERRKFLDIAISQIRPNYFKRLSEYNRYLKSKVRALKEPAYLPMLDVYNRKLTELAADIMLYRHEFIERIKPKMDEINKEITKSDDCLKVEYESMVPMDSDKEKLKNQIFKKFERVRAREILERVCLAGTQREDLNFSLNELSLRDFGSQGQVRTAVLAVKMAQAEIINEDFKEYPILILDDILSELDQTRRQYLLNEIRGKQVLITGTDKANFGRRKDTKLIYIENGKITE